MAFPNIPGFPFTDWGDNPDPTITGWLGGYPWAEVISSGGGTDDATFGASSTQVAMTINVNFGDEKNVIPNILGYSQRSGGSGTPLVNSVNQFYITANVATLFTVGACTLPVGATVVVAGMTNAYLNGTFVITATSAATFSYALTHANVLPIADSGTGTVLSVPKLHRYLPVQHPRYPWLYATRITKIRHLAPSGGAVVSSLAAPAAIGDETIKVSSIIGYDGQALILGNPTDPSEGVMIDTIGTPGPGGTGLTLVNPVTVAHPVGALLFGANTMAQGPNGFYYARYLLSQLTIQFSSLPYTVVSDANLLVDFATLPSGAGDESKRYCEYLTKEGAEFITRRAPISFKWAESGTGLVGPTQNQPVPFDLGQLLIKPTFVVRFHRVPRTWLMDANYVPVCVRAAEGTVNADTFFGRPPGTCLLLEATITPEEDPISPALVGLNPFDPPRTYTVELPFKEFNPKSGLNTYFGHNLAPNPGDGLWYKVTVDGNPVSAGQYLTSQFWQIFGSAT